MLRVLYGIVLGLDGGHNGDCAVPFPVKERLGVFLSTEQEINIEVLKSNFW